MALAGAALWMWLSPGAALVRYKTVPVDREPIVASVTATGTVNPMASAQVGSQVSGKIAKLFADLNSVVTEGQVIGVDNRDFKLTPGMTATVSIVAAHKEEVLRVPNPALRFRLPGTPADRKKSQVWVVDPEGRLHPIPVSTGRTDGTFTRSSRASRARGTGWPSVLNPWRKEPGKNFLPDSGWSREFDRRWWALSF